MGCTRRRALHLSGAHGKAAPQHSLNGGVCSAAARP